MSTRPPPPGAPPAYAFVGRFYRRNLRPVVIATTLIGGIWSILWGVSSLMNLSNNGLRPINIALGTLYLVIAVIVFIGFVAAWRQKIAMVRVYTVLSIAAAGLVLASEGLRFATYFAQKSQLIDDCTADSTGDYLITYGNFWGNSGSGEVLNQDQARSYCNSEWNRQVWSTAAWLVASTFLAVVFVSIAFSYYHQLLSPQQIAPSQAYNMNIYPAPPGPPPQRSEDWVPPYDPAKLPGYGDSSVNLHDTKRVHEDDEDGPVGGRSLEGARNV